MASSTWWRVSSIFSLIITWFVTSIALIKTVSTARQQLTLALLAPLEGHLGFQLNAAGSTMAVWDAQKNGLLKNMDVQIIWKNDNCDGKTALGVLVDAYEQYSLDGVLGLPCSAASLYAAELAAYWNLPVFSYSSSDPDLADKVTYDTLVRLMSPFNHFATAMQQIFNYYSWSRVVMIFGPDPDSYCIYTRLALEGQFTLSGVTIALEIVVGSTYEDSDVQNWISETQLNGRIVILCGLDPLIRELMLAAAANGMTNGDYVYIIPGLLPAPNLLNRWWAGDGLDVQAQVAYQTVLQLAFLPGSNTSESLAFMNIIPYEMSLPPWNYSLTLETNQTGSPFAAFLYDSVYLWALCVDALLAQNQSWKNGSLMFQMAQEQTFLGKSGQVVLDSNGDRLGTYRMWQLPFGGNDYKPFLDVTLDRSHLNGVINFLSVRDWGPLYGEKAPKDAPFCGLIISPCPADNSVRNVTIGVIFAACLVAILLALGGTYIYRKQQFDEQMKLMSWKIRLDEIAFLKKGLTSNSKIQMTSSTVHASSTSSTLEPSDPEVDVDGGEGKVLPSRIRVAHCRETVCAVKTLTGTMLLLTRDDHVELVKMRDLTHDNVTVFVGLCIHQDKLFVLTKYCSRGNLQDILMNDEIKLDENFKRSFIFDIIQGLEYLHRSAIKSHGRLKSSNCLVDSRWVVKLGNWGLCSLQRAVYDNEEEKYRALLWTAPELLINPLRGRNGTQPGDIYSLGIILQEITFRCPPFQACGGDTWSVAKDIIGRVRNGETPPFRPRLPVELKVVDQRFKNLIEDCWAQDPEMRPLITAVRSRFTAFNKGKRSNIMDNMLRMMEKYANNLEEVIGERTRQLMEEKKKADALLYRMLPSSVADSLKLGMAVHPELYKEVTIYFSDIVSFTVLASESSPMEVVDFLNDLWTTFDDIINKYNVYKVETIGDAYMVASGLPQQFTLHALHIADMSLDIVAAVQVFKIRHRPGRQLKIRIGVHSGPVVAALRIHISSECREKLVNSNAGYIIKLRGETMIKGKGIKTTYWLEGKGSQIIANSSYNAETVPDPTANTGQNI